MRCDVLTAVMIIWHYKIQRCAFWNTGTKVVEKIPVSVLRTGGVGGDTSLRRHYVFKN
jgi:hypothetical protein